MSNNEAFLKLLELVRELASDQEKHVRTTGDRFIESNDIMMKLLNGIEALEERVKLVEFDLRLAHERLNLVGAPYDDD